MDRYNIVKAFLSGVDPAIVQQWVAAAPDRFIAAPFILQPGRPDPEMLRTSVRRGALQRHGGDRHAAHRCAAERSRALSRISRLPKSSTCPCLFTRRESGRICPASAPPRATRCCWRRCWSATRSCGSLSRMRGIPIGAR